VCFVEYGDDDINSRLLITGAGKYVGRCRFGYRRTSRSNGV